MRKAKSPPGSTAVRSYGGYVDTGERDRALTNTEKWVTYAKAFAFPPVAISSILRYALASGVRWSLAENEAGGRAARLGVEVAQEGLLNAKLASGTTWPEVVAKASTSWLLGSSLHAWALARRKDGLVVFGDIAHRPMHTIERWLRPGDDETRPFEEVEQRSPTGRTFRIPLSRCLYIVERLWGDDPYGVGVLRQVVERIRRAGHYEALEGSELFSSLGGLPIARVPLEEIEKTAPKDPAKRDAYIAERVQAIETAVRDRIKTPEKQQYLTLSSKPYTGVDPNVFTSVPQWAVEIVKGELQGLAEIRKAVTDLHLDVARVLGVEFVYVGGGDSAGTYGMHESKVTLFQSTLQASITRIAERAWDQLLRPLIAANGLDPDVATPTLVPEKITVTAILDTIAALEGLSRAGLHPKDPARNIIRDRLELPPEPEEALAEELMAPRRPVPDEEEDDEDLDGVDPDDKRDPKPSDVNRTEAE